MTNPTASSLSSGTTCSIRRVDGLSYGDYVEQLTFLLFLKMADEQSRLRGRPSAIPKGKDWPVYGMFHLDDLRPRSERTP